MPNTMLQKSNKVLLKGALMKLKVNCQTREGGGDIDRTKMMEVRTKIMGDTDKKLKAVLTPEQGVKLDAFRKKQAEERAKRMQNR